MKRISFIICFSMFFLPQIIQAIPAPHRVLLVIDTNFEDSITIGNYYRQQREIPDTNIVYVGINAVDRFNNSYGSTTFNRFTNNLLNPILYAISNRGLENVIDYIVLSFGIPTKMYRDIGTVSCSTASYITTWDSYTNDYDWVNMSVNALDITNKAFSCTNLYTFSSRGHKYRLTSHLFAYNVDEVKKGIDNAVLGDGSQIPSTNGRWVTQIGPYDIMDASEGQVLTNYWITQLNLPANWYPKDYNYITGNVTNIIALLHGGTYSGYNYLNYSSLLPPSMALPGAYAEAHESCGCVSDNFFEERSQVQFPEALYFRLGFSGYSGAVVEPYLGFLRASQYTNYAERFRQIMMNGHTLLESSFFGSWSRDRGPNTYIGDPLCRPFAYIPVVTYASPADGQNVYGNVSVNVSAAVSGPNGIGSMELYIDDALVAQASGSSLIYSWNTAGFRDGSHKLYAVAYENSSMLSPGYKIIFINTTNNNRSLQIVSPLSNTNIYGGNIGVTVSGTGTFDTIELLANGSVVASSGALGSISITSSVMPRGAGTLLKARMLQAGSVVAESGEVPVNYFDPLIILSMNRTNMATTNFYTNMDLQFQDAVIGFKVSNVLSGCALYIDGIQTECIAFETALNSSISADAFYRIPDIASPGTKILKLSNMNGAVLLTNAVFYTPAESVIALYPEDLTVYPNEQLKIDYKALDQNGNWLHHDYSLAWLGAAGGTQSGGIYTAGSIQGDFICTLQIGPLITNATVKIRNVVSNSFADNFNNLDNWSFGNTSYPWTVSGNEAIANASGTSYYIYFDDINGTRTNFKGIMEFEAEHTSASVDALFGIKVLGYRSGDDTYPYMKDPVFGISCYNNNIEYNYNTFAHSFGGLTYNAATTIPINTWCKVRIDYDNHYFHASVSTNGVLISDRVMYYNAVIPRTNIIKLIGSYGSHFRNFQFCSWSNYSEPVVIPSVIAASNTVTAKMYSNINDAVNEAAYGHTIYVFPGVYYEKVNFSGKYGIKLISHAWAMSNDCLSTIISAGTTNNVAVSMSSAKKVTLEGFTIREAALYGVEISNTSSSNILSHNLICSNYQAGIYINGNGTFANNILSNTISGDSQFQGIWIVNADTNIIYSNNICGNLSNGIYMTGSAQFNLITGNEFWANSNNGIYLNSTTASYNELLTNRAYGSLQNYGIRANSGYYNNIGHNVFFENRQGGFYLSGTAAFNRIFFNQALSNNNTGYTFSGAAVNTNYFYDNTALGPQQRYGLSVSDGDDNIISNNTFTANTNGINIGLPALSTVIYGNQIYNNLTLGIDINSNSVGTVIRNNTIYGNNSYGIRINHLNADNTFILSNNIYGPGQSSGIYFNQGDSAYVNGNNIHEHTGYGIRVYTNSSCNTLISNTLWGNTTYGIYFERAGSYSNIILANTIHGPSQTYGIFFTTNSGHAASNNIIYSVTEGIRIAAGADTLSLAVNTITNNTYGIRTYSSSGMEIVQNNILGNTTWNFYNQSGGAVQLTNNWWGTTIVSGLSNTINGNGDASNEIPYRLSGAFSTAMGADTIAPPALTMLNAAAAGSAIDLVWNETPDSDFICYNIYRSTQAHWSNLTAADLAAKITAKTTTNYSDYPPVSGTYYYHVTVCDDPSPLGSPHTNESWYSPTAGDTVSVIPNPPAVKILSPVPGTWINSSVVTFNGWASNGSGPASVMLFGTNLSALTPVSCSSGVWSSNLDVSALNGKSNIFYALSSNFSGETATNLQTNMIDLSAPVISLACDYNNALLCDVTNFQGTVYDSFAPVLGGKLVITNAVYSSVFGISAFPTNWTNIVNTWLIPAGSFSLIYSATNEAGLVSIITQTNVLISNSTGSITLSAPVSGSFIRGITNISGTISAGTTYPSNVWMSNSGGGDWQKVTLSGTNWSTNYNTGLLADGTYTFYFMFTVSNGMTNSGISAVYNIDNTIPLLLSASPSNGQTGVSKTSSLSLLFSETMNSDITNCLIISNTNGAINGVWSLPFSSNAVFTPAGDLGGQNDDIFAHIPVTCSDLAGNPVAAADIIFTLSDNTAPSIAIVSPSKFTFMNSAGIIQGTATDLEANLQKVVYTWDNWATEHEAEGKESWIIKAENLPEGTNHILIRALDVPGLYGSSASLAVCADFTPPAVNLPAKITTNAYFEYATNIIISASDLNMENFSYSANGSEYIALKDTLSLNLSFTKSGVYTYNVRARDKAGNESRLGICFTFDISLIDLAGLSDGARRWAKGIRDEDLAHQISSIKIRENGIPVIEYLVKQTENRGAAATIVSRRDDNVLIVCKHNKGVTEEKPKKVTIYDRSGVIIRQLDPAGMRDTVVVWDKKDKSGKPVNNGIYFLIVEYAGMRSSIPVVIMNKIR